MNTIAAELEIETRYTAETLTQRELRRLWEAASMLGVGVSAGFRGRKMVSLVIHGERATLAECRARLGA